MWLIIIACLVLSILFFIQFLRPKIKEGFEDSSNDSIIASLGKSIVCPVLKNNLEHNKKILEGYKERDAVTSAESAVKVIDSILLNYTKHGCDTYDYSDVPT